VAKVLGDAYAQLLQMRASVTYTVGVFATVRDAERRILLVEQSYAGRHWAQPGGGLEDGENPIDGVLREILEETGYIAEVTGFIGTYVSVFRSDIVLHFAARIVRESEWKPNREILQRCFFRPNELPAKLRANTRARILDGIEDRRNVFRTLSAVDTWTDLEDIR
jgi:8-oxo-dGTP diphosphatase